MHLNAAQELLASDKVSTLSLYLHNTAATEGVAPWVNQQLTDLGLAQSLEVTPWQNWRFLSESQRPLRSPVWRDGRGDEFGGVCRLV
ncbi:hypothetical protein PCI56_01835 [Plesiomonas shigelloides subsp. oncorhynchi]|nr:hypothetical protein [Plesiomonas shigelloides]